VYIVDIMTSTWYDKDETSLIHCKVNNTLFSFTPRVPLGTSSLREKGVKSPSPPVGKGLGMGAKIRKDLSYSVLNQS